MEGNFSPRKEKTDALILSISVGEAKDNHFKYDHTARLIMKGKTDFVWTNLESLVLMKTARKSPRGILGKDSFTFQKFPITGSRIEISFKLWLSGAISCLEWFNTRIDTSKLQFSAFSCKTKPPSGGNLLSYTEAGEEALYKTPVLSDRAILSFTYQAECVFDAELGCKVGRVAIKELRLELKNRRLLDDILNYKGHKVGLLVKGRYLGRANIIQDILLEEDGSMETTRTGRLSTNIGNKEEQQKMAVRIYTWEEEEICPDPMAVSPRKIKRTLNPTFLGDMRDLKRISQADRSRSVRDFDDPHHSAKNKEIPYIPDSPSCVNKFHLLPIPCNPLDIQVELKFVNLKHDPVRMMTIPFLWGDFLLGLTKEKVFVDKTEKKKATKEKKVEKKKKIKKDRVLIETTQKGKQNRRQWFGKRKNKESFDRGEFGEIVVQPATGVTVTIKYKYFLKKNGTEHVDITLIEFKVEHFEETLLFEDFKHSLDIK